MHDPPDGDRLQQAHALFRERRFAEAEQACREILGGNPDHVGALQLLGAIALLLGFAREGVPILARAAELDPRNIGVLRDLARCQRQAGDPAAAAETTRRRLDLEPEPAQVWADLGTLQTEAGDLEAARESLRRAVTRMPAFGDAWYALARLKRFEPDDPDIAVMQRELERPGVGTNEVVSLNYALGKAFEDLDDRAAAMAHYTAGARARHASVHYDAAAYRRFTDATIRAFPRLHADSGEDDRPRPVFLVGMPRSGSTLVEQILAQHPDVNTVGEFTAFPGMVSRLGEVLADRGGYPDGAGRLTAQELDQMAGAYREQLQRVVSDGRVVIDKMLKNYLYCGLIAMVFPSARFVHCRRDPLDTCFSCYTTIFGAGQEYSYDLEELGTHYAAYHRLMAHWKDLLGERVTTVDYETLIREPEGTVRDLLGSLELDWHAACLEFAASRRPVRTASMAQVRQPLYDSAAGRGHRFAGHLKPLIDALEAGGVSV